MLKLDSLHFKHNSKRRKLIFFDNAPIDLVLVITFVHVISKSQANGTNDILHKMINRQGLLERKQAGIRRPRCMLGNLLVNRNK